MHFHTILCAAMASKVRVVNDNSDLVFERIGHVMVVFLQREYYTLMGLGSFIGLRGVISS